MYLIASFLIKKKKRRNWFTRHANLPNLFKERPRKALKALMLLRFHVGAQTGRSQTWRRKRKSLGLCKKIHHSAVSKDVTGDVWFTSRWWKVIQSENYSLEGDYRRWCLHLTHKLYGEEGSWRGRGPVGWYCKPVRSAGKGWFLILWYFRNTQWTQGNGPRSNSLSPGTAIGNLFLTNDQKSLRFLLCSLRKKLILL